MVRMERRWLPRQARTTFKCILCCAMKKLFTPLLLLAASFGAHAQTSILSTNAAAETAMRGLHDPVAYAAAQPITHPDSIARGILARVSPDSLKSYLLQMRPFKNRNSGADTVSQTIGIGAARRWVHNKFAQWGAASGGRLIPSYLQFNLPICGQNQHRNILAVLPGSDTTDKSIILLEGHIDSRCAGLCDTACVAEGMEDNASGTALVMELARVMSRYTFKRTIVFMVTIAEEQGLYGAAAFADYALQKGITIRAVMNNDVIGGILCGQTSSAPSCPGLNAVDSTGVRLFSFGGFNSFHKGLARFVKLEYKEMIRPYAAVPMDIRIMTPEDRTGRGGDHIPFRQKGFPAAVRYTSANEHGNADVTAAGYSDRQHTSADVLGVDSNGDSVIDSFFVDFNYLARNAVINGAAAAMAACGPKTPTFGISPVLGAHDINIAPSSQAAAYRIGVRTASMDWDTVYTSVSPMFLFVEPANTYFISTAVVDSAGVESLFSDEKNLTVVSVGKSPDAAPPIRLLQNTPNPFDEATMISVHVHGAKKYSDAYVRITSLDGKQIARLPIVLKAGMNEVVYRHGYGAAGTFIYSLVVDGKVVESRRMVFRN